MADQELCPCSSEKVYSECCEPVCNGSRRAVTAEELMRSRYTAYATSQIDHLANTTHPKSRGDFDAAAARKWADSSDWHGFEVIETSAGGADDQQGTVEFFAHFAEAGQVRKHHEIATFIRHDGEWFFEDARPGKADPYVRPTAKVGRNDPCPCGSGKKYKKCCL